MQQRGRGATILLDYRRKVCAGKNTLLISWGNSSCEAICRRAFPFRPKKFLPTVDIQDRRLGPESCNRYNSIGAILGATIHLTESFDCKIRDPRLASRGLDRALSAGISGSRVVLCWHHRDIGIIQTLYAILYNQMMVFYQQLHPGAKRPTSDSIRQPKKEITLARCAIRSSGYNKPKLFPYQTVSSTDKAW